MNNLHSPFRAGQEPSDPLIQRVYFDYIDMLLNNVDAFFESYQPHSDIGIVFGNLIENP